MLTPSTLHMLPHNSLTEDPVTVSFGMACPAMTIIARLAAYRGRHSASVLIRSKVCSRSNRRGSWWASPLAWAVFKHSGWHSPKCDDVRSTRQALECASRKLQSFSDKAGRAEFAE